MEVSFYGDELKTLETYKRLIKEFFPRNNNHLIKYKCFKYVHVKHYFKTLFEGEKKFGRYIYINHQDNNKLKLTFIRFIN